MAKKPETRLQQNIQRDLKREVGGKWWKVHGSMFQESGMPDIDGAVDGIPFKFEVKLPFEGEPSDIQLDCMEEWREEGVIACIVETSAQAISLVKAAQEGTAKGRRGRRLYKWICRTLRAAHGEDMGYGRRPVRYKKPTPRHSSGWAVNQLVKYLGKDSVRKGIVVHGAP